VAKAQHSTDVPEPVGEEDQPDISRDTVYKMLANRRRRYTIHYLKEQGGSVPLGLLAEQVGAWEQDTHPDELSSSERKTVYTALQQRHLPKMDDAGMLEFDKRAGVIEPTESLEDIDIYAEIVEGGEFPWSQYYLGLSMISVALMIAVWANVAPLIMLPDIAWGVFCAVAFTVSAVSHVVATREMKLGAASEPPLTQGDQ
jgi:hypothetical protein